MVKTLTEKLKCTLVKAKDESDGCGAKVYNLKKLLIESLKFWWSLHCLKEKHFWNDKGL